MPIMRNARNHAQNESRNEVRAVRSILFVDGKLVMIQSKKYGEYKFPGGKVEKGENTLTALKREVLEEAGMKITDQIESFGYISESRAVKDHPSDSFRMRSDYYLCSIEESGLPQNLIDYEVDYDYRVVIVDPREALMHNESLYNDPIPWNKRECKMLAQIIEANLCKQ